MLDKMVPYVNLVFTTLSLLNSIGIVSSQDGFGQGLATDCEYKCMKA